MKLTTALALVALAMPLALQAQRPDPPTDRRPALPGSLDVFLMLTPDQLMSLRQHQQGTEMELRQINRRATAARWMLAEALQADPPDDAAVGALFRQVTALQQRAGAVRRTRRERTPDAIGLTMDQRERLGLLQRALALQALAQAALRLNLIAPPRGRGDDREPQDAGPRDGAPPPPPPPGPADARPDGYRS